MIDLCHTQQSHQPSCRLLWLQQLRSHRLSSLDPATALNHMQQSGRQLMGTTPHQVSLEVMVLALEGLVQEKVEMVQSSKLTSTGYHHPCHSCLHHESKNNHKVEVWVRHSTQTSTGFHHLHHSCCRHVSMSSRSCLLMRQRPSC